MSDPTDGVTEQIPQFPPGPLHVVNLELPAITLPVLQIRLPDQPIVLLHIEPRLVDLLNRIILGATNREIAEALGLNTKTVKNYCTSLFAVMDVPSRREAAILGYRLATVLYGQEFAMPPCVHRYVK